MMKLGNVPKSNIHFQRLNQPIKSLTNKIKLSMSMSISISRYKSSYLDESKSNIQEFWFYLVYIDSSLQKNILMKRRKGEGLTIEAYSSPKNKSTRVKFQEHVYSPTLIFRILDLLC